MTDGVGWYLQQATRVPLLTPSEEVALGNEVQQMMELRDLPCPTSKQKRIIRRGLKAKERMFKANLRLVVHISQKHNQPTLTHMSLLDLIQEGNIGLSRAIEKFDPSRGYKFSTYSYWWIRQAVTRAISNSERTIRLPINAISLQGKVSNFAEEFKNENGRAPSVEECSDRFGVLVRTMRGYLEHTQRPLSLDQIPYGDLENGSVSPLIDAIASSSVGPEEELEIQNGLDHLSDLMSSLSPRDRYAMELRYGLKGKEPMTYSDIGEILNISRERVRQIEIKSLRLMRAKMLYAAEREKLR